MHDCEQSCCWATYTSMVILNACGGGEFINAIDLPTFRSKLIDLASLFNCSSS